MREIWRQAAHGWCGALLSSGAQVFSFCFAMLHECLLSSKLPHSPRELLELQASRPHSGQEGESGKSKRHVPTQSVPLESFPLNNFLLCLAGHYYLREAGKCSFYLGTLLVRKKERIGVVDTTRSACHLMASQPVGGKARSWGPLHLVSLPPVPGLLESCMGRVRVKHCRMKH